MDAERYRRPLLYRVPGLDLVERRADVVYGRGGEAELRLDVYRPTGGAPAPGVVLVHGGPLPPGLPVEPKDWGVYRGYGALAAASGFVGVTLNHRFTGVAELPTASGDVAAAIDHVRARAGEIGLDPERLAVWAFSGGGALLAPLLRERPSWLRAVVAYYAVLDLRGLPEQYRGGASDEMLAAFSPAAAVSAGAPPIFVARAGLDTPGLNGAAAAFVEAALAANAPLTLVNHPAGRHGFDVEDDVPRTHEVVAATLAFLREALTG